MSGQRIRTIVLMGVFGLVMATATASAAAGLHVYVANVGSSDVSVIDADTNTVVAAISLQPFSWPGSLALTPDGKKLYVTQENTSFVSVIDTATNTLTTTITVGYSPRGVGVSPDGTRAYVANTFGSSVSIIDTGTDSVVDTVALEGLPVRLAVNPNGNFVYTTNYTSNSVSVIDTHSHAVVATIPVASSPVGIAVSPDGSAVYVTHDSFVLSVINAHTNTVVATVPVGLSRGVAVSADGSRVYVSNLVGSTVTVVDAISVSVVTTIPLPDYSPVGVAFSEGRVYVTHQNLVGKVSVIDATSNTLVSSILVGSYPDGVTAQTSNRPPLAEAGPNQTVECASRFGSPVRLDASQSTDPDGDPLTFSWSAPGITFDDPSSATPTGTFPLGTTTVTLVVNDGIANSVDTVEITAQDAAPPAVVVTASPSSLWPPDHQYRLVTLAVIGGDACDPSPRYTAVVRSSEPDEGSGDGNTSGDIKVITGGGSVLKSSNTSPAVTFDPVHDRLWLRAERSGSGQGRTYAMTITATDVSGNQTVATAIVSVPHDGH